MIRLSDDNLVAPCGLYCGECSAFQDKSCGGCISREGLCLKYSEICNIYECCIKDKKYRFCSKCKDFPCRKIERFFDTPEWHNEVVNNLKQISRKGIKQFLSRQVRRVTELINCAKRNKIKHCSECKNWPCEKLKREPLTPA